MRSAATLAGLERLLERRSRGAAADARPGRSTRTCQLPPVARTAGTRPACTNDDLPTPDGPITASSGHASSCASAVRISLLAAEEVLRVVLAERREPAIRALVLAGALGASARGTPADRRAARVALWIALALRASRGSGRRSRRARAASTDRARRCSAAACRDRVSRTRSLSGVIVPAGCTPVSARQNMMPTRPDIRLVIDDVGAPLLGRHVRQRADQRVAAGERHVRVAVLARSVPARRRRGRARHRGLRRDRRAARRRSRAPSPGRGR